MAAESPERWQPDWALNPGEILAEALEERSMTQVELARRMGERDAALVADDRQRPARCEALAAQAIVQGDRLLDRCISGPME